MAKKDQTSNSNKSKCLMHTYRCWKKQLWSLQSGNSACISIKYPQNGEQAREREGERKKRKDTEEHHLEQKALDGLQSISWCRDHLYLAPACQGCRAELLRGWRTGWWMSGNRTPICLFAVCLFVFFLFLFLSFLFFTPGFLKTGCSVLIIFTKGFPPDSCPIRRLCWLGGFVNAKQKQRKPEV